MKHNITEHESLLSFYQAHRFNPVPVNVEERSVWESHLAKRRNLYERHLGIPLSFLRGRSVLEVGCNSGENALVLASVGANLTLIEPNEQVLPRVLDLFKKFGYEKHIVALLQEEIKDFEPETLYDVVIAEGFLFTLPNRDEMIKKICRLLAPGGLAVISFNDRYGGFLEMTRRMILWRACQLNQIDDIHSRDSLELAMRLFLHDFSRLNTSRPFEVWWRDTLTNPFYVSAYLWSYPEVVQLIEGANCEFYSSSPKWASIDDFTWYKEILSINGRHRRLLDNWRRVFPFFLTGLEQSRVKFKNVTSETFASVSKVIEQVSEYTSNLVSSPDYLLYPSQLDEYFKKSKDTRLVRFNTEVKGLYESVRSCGLDDLLSAYSRARYVRSLWGTPYHYMCFGRLS